jgi:hypothetical protein
LLRIASSLLCLSSVALAQPPAAAEVETSDQQDPLTAAQPPPQEAPRDAVVEADAAPVTTASGQSPQDAWLFRLDHEYQLGIRVGFGVPFFFAIRYDADKPCDLMNSQFCVGIGSGIADLDLSFGITRDLEITAFVRLGLAPDVPTITNRVLVGLGLRYYVVPESVLKPYLGVRGILDVTSRGALTSLSDVDGGLRGEFGVQCDIVRYVGLYVQLGVNILFARALYVGPDLTGGVQARFP